MTIKNFDWVIEKTLENIKTTLLIKGKEYVRNSNPLHNFEEGAKIEGKIREDICWGFALKHFISIQDIKTDLRIEQKLPSKDQVEEKYNDLILYLMIEKASLIDRIQESELIKNNYNEIIFR